MQPGYNTNGFAHHRLEDALAILADLGYRSVALTLDHHALNPYDADFSRQRADVGRLLRKWNLRCVIETGARFLLDARRKHQPTLLAPEPESRRHRRVFLQHAIDLAAEFQADAVSFWSGTPLSDEPIPVLQRRLMDECRILSEFAQERNVRLAFEPEPGMLIATMADFAFLHRAVDHPCFGLTMDLGHLFCQREDPIEQHIRKWCSCLWNIHLEDSKRGVHEHLPFGEGEMCFGPIFQALHEVDYTGGLHVELSRHSHDAVHTASRSMDFLAEAIEVASKCSHQTKKPVE